MAGFGSLFRLYVRGFRETVGHRIWLEPRGHLERLRNRCRHSGVCAPRCWAGGSPALARRIILPCMTVFGCGIASPALLRSGAWQFYVTCFVLGGVGNEKDAKTVQGLLRRADVSTTLEPF